MKKDRLEIELAEMKKDFTPFFHTRTMAAVMASESVLNIKRPIFALAACVILVLALVYVQDGQLSLDSLVGVSDLNEYSITDYEIYH
jgi:hypothetical protein